MDKLGLYGALAAAHPAIERGQVWCRGCGHTMKVNPAHCLQHGWPRCCGETMTIDSPEERSRDTDHD